MEIHALLYPRQKWTNICRNPNSPMGVGGTINSWNSPLHPSNLILPITTAAITKTTTTCSPSTSVQPTFQYRCRKILKKCQKRVLLIISSPAASTLNKHCMYKVKFLPKGLLILYCNAAALLIDHYLHPFSRNGITYSKRIKFFTSQ